MTDRPIIFAAPMVRALLNGRKTQTRRLATSPLRRVEVDDRLYVREGMYLWSAGHDAEVTFAADDARIQTGPNKGEIPDASLAAYFRMVDQSRQKGKRISRPSIHMPRWASRLTLIVEGVKVEPLQAMEGHHPLESDAIAEGVRRIHHGDGAYFYSAFNDEPDPHNWCDPADAFRELWDSLHGADGERWSDNPDVVALTFRVVRGNIDRIEA